jgi:glycerol kinase
MRIDGGMASNDWMCRFLADMIDTPVERPSELEATARGAAFHAGLCTGLWSGLADLSRLWSSEARFEPSMSATVRTPLIAGWRDAVRRTLSAGPA